MNTKKTLKLQGNYSREALQKIIVTPTVRPDRFAVHLYLYIRSQIRSYNAVLKTNYPDSMKANYCSSHESMRRKLKKLEELGLIKKSFSFVETLSPGCTNYNILNISLVEAA